MVSALVRFGVGQHARGGFNFQAYSFKRLYILSPTILQVTPLDGRHGDGPTQKGSGKEPNGSRDRCMPSVCNRKAFWN